MKVGDLVIMKSKPTSIGIIVGIYQDVYPRGLQGEEVSNMATVHWWIGAEVSYEVYRLEVIG